MVELVLIKEGLSENEGLFLTHPGPFDLYPHEFRPSGGGDEFLQCSQLKKTSHLRDFKSFHNRSV